MDSMTDKTQEGVEVFDIINEDDVVIGQATRDECHSNPKLLHRTVHFTLVDSTQNTILITQRSFKKKNDAGKYCFLGEHVISRETYEDAVTRGVIEELGFKPILVKEVSKQLFKYDNQSELVKLFIVFYKNEQLNWDSDEIESLNWVKLDKLTEKPNYSGMTNFWIKHVNLKELI